MYNILVVDDEPLICKGLAGLLTSSGLAIEGIATAYSGQEALDYIRMGDIDLLVTDIQMGEMNGIELMQQAKIIKPWVQTIIISAHETFQYAQRALQLGAKDYLIKPLDSEQFLDSVRSVLLKMDRSAPQVEQFLLADNEHFRMEEPPSERVEQLNQRLSMESSQSDQAESDESELGLIGPYFAVIKMKLDLTGERSAPFTRHDISLIQYAALNIAKELLEQEAQTLVFYSPERDVNIVLQWSEQEMEENASGKIHHLEMIGRSLHHHVELHLKQSCTVGISQILRGPEFLSVLSRQADKAMLWSEQLHDFHVFYYGDFNWHNYAQETSQEVLSSQSNRIVENTRQYIEDHYRQKGLTIHEVAKNNHVSPNYLSYLFKKYTGSSLWEYVVKLRMEESRSLILSTDLRRYEIAERVGYESPEHFSKIFKKYYGVSPSELKK
ncbi:response regulator transcription factor [Paenibacillus solani]|uniref:response regulator transcription factor n=1 Tax=Paenibacillus solani TaxID=1705565 RepID=UPI003D29C09B